MSNLLQEAIVDAKALREVALKNAETAIIEKYSEEVKSALDKLLEQEEDLGMDMGMAAADPAMDMGGDAAGAAGDVAQDVPLASADDEELCPCPGEGEDVEVSVDLDELQEAVKALESEAEIDINEENILELLSDDEEIQEAATDAGSFAGSESEEGGSESGATEAGEAAAEEADSDAMSSLENPKTPQKENVDYLDSLVDAITEKLTVDMGADLSGWAGRSSADKKHEIEKELAHRRSTDVDEEMEALKKAQEDLVFENNQLAERNNQYEQAFQELKESLHEVNLSNARLLYTNRVLKNTSLNERQKNKIAEALSGAGSVAEAKTIYETLQSTVESTPKGGPKSLSEVISSRSSVIRATRQESTSSDPFTDRMKKLAGIN